MQIIRHIFNKIAHYLIFCRKILIIDIFSDKNKRALQTASNEWGTIHTNTVPKIDRPRMETDEHEKKRNRNLRFKRSEGLKKKIEKHKKPKKAVYLRFERISRKRRVGVLCMWKKSSTFADTLRMPSRGLIKTIPTTEQTITTIQG